MSVCTISAWEPPQHTHERVPALSARIEASVDLSVSGVPVSVVPARSVPCDATFDAAHAPDPAVPTAEANVTGAVLRGDNKRPQV
ncbi:hypothetical protein TRAPUB_302 [Trametes pubescens]|uniref:Uncharacterized protein n=1 Tax=Trametes pubescens TaxID=154538 RepID=A0A1M2VMJ9_TRAPU|nr:hypothetical protein TRAPUB_302 [Trametes pubescens]